MFFRGGGGPYGIGGSVLSYMIDDVGTLLIHS